VLFIIVTFAKFYCGQVRVTAADDRVMSIIHRAHSPVKLIKYVLWRASHHALLTQQQHSGSEPSVSWWSVRWIRRHRRHLIRHAAVHAGVFVQLPVHHVRVRASCDEPHLALVCEFVLFTRHIQHVSQLSYGDHVNYSVAGGRFWFTTFTMQSYAISKAGHSVCVHQRNPVSVIVIKMMCVVILIIC